MPPCKNILLNKVERTKYLSKIIKSTTGNSIERPEKGWTVNENQFMEINYCCKEATFNNRLNHSDYMFANGKRTDAYFTHAKL